MSVKGKPFQQLFYILYCITVYMHFIYTVGLNKYFLVFQAKSNTGAKPPFPQRTVC